MDQMLIDELVYQLEPVLFFVAGCYALPPEDSLTAVAITGTNLKNPSGFCRTSCLAKSSHYFYIQQNNTCQCIGKTPLGGNVTSFINGGTMTDFYVVSYFMLSDFPLKKIMCVRLFLKHHKQSCLWFCILSFKGEETE